MTELDFDVLRVRSLFSRLPAHPPITDAYTKARGGYNAWYRSEREHMLGWFNAQSTNGAGSYTRDEPNRSAKRTYNRLQNAASLIWLAEVFGVEESLVLKAAAAASAEPDHRRRCSAVRKVVPWSVLAPCIETRMGHAHGWPQLRSRPS